MTMTILFDDARAVDVAQVGGKAASLGRLTQAGFRVPTGFTVSTEAQAAFFLLPTISMRRSSRC